MSAIKTLLFYWYVKPSGWCELYDFHLKNLNVFKTVFDKQIFIISHDLDTDKNLIDSTRLKIYDIFPNAEFRDYNNDRELRESKWFYNEVATKLNVWPDQWYFFAHNKGVDTYYVSKDYCYKWIAAMYFLNLYDIKNIEYNMNIKETCAIGTYLFRNDFGWKFNKYGWHFSGTFWWFNPQKVYTVMKKYNNTISENNRYFTEGFFGSIIPDDDCYRRPALMIYNADWHKGFNWMPSELVKKLYNNLGML